MRVPALVLSLAMGLAGSSSAADEGAVFDELFESDGSIVLEAPENGASLSAASVGKVVATMVEKRRLRA